MEGQGVEVGIFHAGVGVVGLKGAPVSMPTFATAQFRRFFECGGAIRCLLPLGGNELMVESGGG